MKLSQILTLVLQNESDDAELIPNELAALFNLCYDEEVEVIGVRYSCFSKLMMLSESMFTLKTDITFYVPYIRSTEDKISLETRPYPYFVAS